MKCEFFNDAGGFQEVAAGFLLENEAENTVLLGHARRCMHRPRRDAVMAAVQDGDAVRLAAMMIPPHALVLSARGREGIPCLVEAVREAGVEPPGVVGIEPMAERFAALWRGREWPAAEVEMRTILYRAERIAAPGNVPGELRRASDDEIEWLAAWQRRFADQASLSAAERAADMRTVVAARIARGEMYLWAVEGRPVASAAFIPTTPAGDAGRINAVFTLEEERAGAMDPPASPRSAGSSWIAAGAIAWSSPTRATRSPPGSILGSGTGRSRASRRSGFAAADAFLT